MATVRELIKGAMTTLGVISANEQPSAEDISVCYVLYKQLVESLSTNILNMYTVSPSIWTLEPEQSEYTIGPGGDFDTARPVRIERIVFLYCPKNTKVGLKWTSEFQPTTQSTDLEQWSPAEFADIRTRDFKSTFIKGYLDSKGCPLRKLTFWPAPLDRHAVEIWSYDELEVGTLDSEVTFPVGYVRYLKLKLAQEIAPTFGKELPQSFQASLKEAEDNVKNLNAQSQASKLKGR